MDQLLILYPNQNTLGLTEHFYLHSLLGLPYYILNPDPLETYNFIFAVQLVIAFTGFFFLARKFSNSITAIILGGLYFSYLPAFIDKHPQINFYGFLPWFIFFLMEFLEKKKPKDLYLCGLAFILQASVGLYLELFLLVCSSLLLFFLLIYLGVAAQIRQYFTAKTLGSIAILLLLVSAFLLLLNWPYLQIHSTGTEVYPTSMKLLASRSPDLIDFFRPDWRSQRYGLWLQDKHLFLGVTGIIVVALSLWAVLQAAVSRSFFFHNSWKIFFLCFGFLMSVWILSLGPFPRIAGSSVGLKLPYHLLYFSHDAFRSIRTISRLIVFMSLPLALLMVWWYDEIKRTKLPTFFKVGILILFVILLLKDIYRDRRDSRDSGLYERSYVYSLVDQAPGAVLLELPSGGSCGNLRLISDCISAKDAYYEFMHIYHGKWIVNGYRQRAGSSGVDYAAKSYQISEKIDQHFDKISQLKEVLVPNGISMILIHRYRIDPDYLHNYEVLITNLLSLYRISYMDENFALLISETSLGRARKQEALEKRRRKFSDFWAMTSQGSDFRTPQRIFRE